MLCTRCGKFETTAAFPPFYRCTKCNNRVHTVLLEFRTVLLKFVEDGTISAVEWKLVTEILNRNRVNIQEALAFIQNDAVQIIWQVVNNAARDGIITAEEEKNIYDLRTTLNISNTAFYPIQQRIAELRHLAQQHYQTRLERFRQAFLNCIADASLTEDKWQTLVAGAKLEKLDKTEALNYIRSDALNYLETVFTLATADGYISEKEEAHIRWVQTILAIPNEAAKPLLLKYLTSVRWESHKTRALERFRDLFNECFADGQLTEDEWASLKTAASKNSIDMADALKFVQSDAVKALERVIAFATADQIITAEEETYIRWIKSLLVISDEAATPVLRRIDQVKELMQIRAGNLPTVKTNALLDSDEICHLEVKADYLKGGVSRLTIISGRLIATNQKLRFVATTGGDEINWSSVVNVSVEQGMLYLAVSKKSGGGLYKVPDPYLAEAVIETLVKVAKRHLLTPGDSEIITRHIPQEVKSAVWQRDQGKCVQCQATSYLEFDHIIPHAKGGANTTGNVQLLCRRCNLAKSDRI